MSIIIPDRIKNKLLKDQKWDVVVKTLIQNTEPYFENLPLKFFPEYTIHGIQHINHVLEIIDNLIPNKTFEKLTEKQLGILVCSAILHDIGMFIQEDGVHSLLYGKYKNNKTDLLDEYTWNELWSKYSKEILRYSDEKIYNLFGIKGDIEIPPSDMNKLISIDYKIYGEFLRRYHHRLAYEFVKDGFYGSQCHDIFANISITDSEKNIIGIIARSHGMAIRDTEQFIMQSFTSMRMPYDVPIVYLMALLRLADYLDAGESRAPVELLEAQKIDSQISIREWNWNQTIEFNSYSWKDTPDTLMIHSDPKDNLTYLTVKKWLHGVQNELDLCWALICEYCFDYKLSIHRIKSNITDENSIKLFKKSFSTEEVNLKSNPNLLKLLIKPLYGDNPTYGVRELIQNAVDACLEREVLEKKANNIYEGKIDIYVDEKSSTFTIIDNGIGMDENTIISYFLNVGASYRFSEDWNEKYTTNNKSTIHRTGKFGIGVLASFLIGDEIEIITRSIDDKIGYKFNVSLANGNSNINLMRTKDVEIGTKIAVNISYENLKYFNIDFHSLHTTKWFNWYHLKNPQINYFFNNQLISVNTIYVPNLNETYENWFNLNSKNFTSYNWTYTYSNNKKNGMNVNYYNGISVKEICTTEFDKYGIKIKLPTISIIDNNNLLNINLSRNKILEIPEQELLTYEIYKYLIAKLLVIDWSNQSVIGRQISLGFSNICPCLYDNNDLEHDFIFFKKGYSILLFFFLTNNAINDLLLIHCNTYALICKNILELNAKKVIGFLSDSSDETNYIIQNTYRPIERERRSYAYQLSLNNMWLNSDQIDAKKHLLDKTQYNIKLLLENYNKPKKFINYFSHQNLINIKNIENVENILPNNISPNIISSISQFTVNFESKLQNNLMIQAIKEYLGDDIWIPIDMEERKKKFPKAFKELAKYMEAND